MEPLYPMFWGQGMLLQPQHFQQQDRYHEARLRRSLHWLLPFCWGIRSLFINEEALRNFVFEVERCEMMTLDSTIVRFQGEMLPSNAVIRPRSFERALDPGGKPLGVYLGLKRLQMEEPNLSSLSLNGNGAGRSETGVEKPRRFSLQEAEVADLFAEDGQSCAVQVLLYEARVFFDTDAAIQGSDREYELVQIAELLREGQRVVLSKRYIPPALAVNASPVLTGMLEDMRNLLTAKGREFTEYKQQRRVHTIDMGSRDTVFLLMMQMVNRYIPLFHHYLEAEETHPYVFYALLRQLIGEFSTFSETVSVLGGPLPAYRHDRLWECFDAAIRVAKELLNELTKGPEYVISLTFDGDYYSAKLNDRFFEGSNHYYLAIKVDMPPRELERRLMETGKVCSREDMEELRRRALPGLTVRYLEVPPEELPRRAHCNYFELDHRGLLWSRIEQRQNIAVYCQIEPNEVEMQLLVLYET